jgi:hypothetical protein
MPPLGTVSCHFHPPSIFTSNIMLCFHYLYSSSSGRRVIDAYEAPVWASPSASLDVVAFGDDGDCLYIVANVRHAWLYGWPFRVMWRKFEIKFWQWWLWWQEMKTWLWWCLWWGLAESALAGVWGLEPGVRRLVYFGAFGRVLAPVEGVFVFN